MIGFTPGQIFLVTGASSGIGRELALLLNRLGATVIASARNSERLLAVRGESSCEERFFIEMRDLVENLDALPDWIKGLRERYGKLHGLAHCAGQTWTQPLQSYSMEKAGEAFNLCCHAPLLLARGFTDRRNNIGQGASLVFLAAGAATEPNPGQGMYAAAKAALVAASRCLSKEVAPHGIRVNCVSPGFVEGTAMADSTARLLGENFLERERALYPLGFGRASDVAALTAFLLSSHARWISGINIPLTGGR